MKNFKRREKRNEDCIKFCISKLNPQHDYEQIRRECFLIVFKGAGTKEETDYIWELMAPNPIPV